ncbi:hypothetical protein LCGC14_2625240, partial [marine sediment metagenome]
VAESPLGFEMPSNVDISAFEKKLHERTKIISNLIKSKHSKTILLSPAIRVLSDVDIQERYLEYFFHNRTLFDAFSLHCCTDMKDHQLGALTSFLNQILKSSFKPTWITKWGIPSCDHLVESSRMIVPSTWKPVPSSMAVRNFQKTYETINEVAKDNTVWFFVGIGEDMYHPNEEAPTACWQPNSLYRSDQVSSSWSSEHFIGAIDYEGNLKERMLNGFLNLYKSQN